MDLLKYTIVPDHILSGDMADTGFLVAVCIAAKTCGTTLEIAESLTASGYPCTRQQVAMAIVKINDKKKVDVIPVIRVQAEVFKNVEEIYREFPGYPREQLTKIVNPIVKWFSSRSKALVKNQVIIMINKSLFLDKEAKDDLETTCVLCAGSGKIEFLNKGELEIEDCSCKVS